MIGWVNAFRTTDDMDDKIEARGSFTGSPEVMHTLEFELSKNEKRVGREGVAAAFYGAEECSGDGTLVNFNWSAPRAIESYKEARTGSNWVVTNPRSAGHERVPHDSARNREGGICRLREFSGGIESIAQVLVYVMG
jgi:hypothetical protein